MAQKPACVPVLSLALIICILAARLPVSAALVGDSPAPTVAGSASLAQYTVPVHLQLYSARAQRPSRTRLTRGTASRGAEFDRVINLLLDAYAAALPELPWYAVTDITPSPSRSKKGARSAGMPRSASSAGSRADFGLSWVGPSIVLMSFVRNSAFVVQIAPREAVADLGDQAYLHFMACLDGRFVDALRDEWERLMSAPAKFDRPTLLRQVDTVRAYCTRG